MQANRDRRTGFTVPPPFPGPSPSRKAGFEKKTRRPASRRAECRNPKKMIFDKSSYIHTCSATRAAKKKKITAR